MGERFDVLWCRSASGAWSFCSDVSEFKALVESLGRTDDEKKLKRVLLKLAPIFERSLGSVSYTHLTLPTILLV